MRSVSLLLAMAAAAMFVSAENTGAIQGFPENMWTASEELDLFDDTMMEQIKMVERPETVYSEDEEPLSLDVTVTKAGELATVLGDNILSVSSLIVKGPINADDFTTIFKASLHGHLEILDLENAEIENNVIPDSVFLRDEQLESGYMESLALKKIKLPDSVTEIGQQAFQNLRYLTEVNIPKSLKKLGAGCFSWCVKLNFDKLVFPYGITEIPMYAFRSCYKLTCEVVLHEGIKAIGREAFRSASISKINFPAGLEEIGPMAFQSTGLKEVEIINGDISMPVLHEIHGAQFSENPYLESVTLPEGMTTIVGSCFRYCRSLRDVIMPHTLTTIETRAFEYCESLKELCFPQSIKEIQKYAFWDCDNLETVDFPSSIEHIGLGSFALCENVKTYYCEATTPPYCEMQIEVDYVNTPFGTVFQSKKISTPLYVPVGTAELYRQSPSWYYFENIVETDRFPSASVEGVTADGRPADDTIYDLQGRRIERPAAGQIYIQGGRKMLAK